MISFQRQYFECINSGQNRFAFYELITGRDLFGWIIIRRWGRIGTKGQPPKTQRFSEKAVMMREYDRVYRERIKHQYKPVTVKTRRAPQVHPIHPLFSRPRSSRNSLIMWCS